MDAEMATRKGATRWPLINALRSGAHSVVVGTAITAPTALTSRFVGALARRADDGVDGPDRV